MILRSTATKTAATRTHAFVLSVGRSHTIAAATAQRTPAKMRASRTVETMVLLIETPAKTLTTPAGETMAQMKSAPTKAIGTSATMRAERLGASFVCGRSVRSTQPAKRTHAAVA